MTAQIAPTMWASVMKEVGVEDLEQRPTPQPASDEVLVSVASVGVCGSDVHYYTHGRIADFVVNDPIVLGHELSGTIVAVGADVDPARIGERVAVEPQRSCGVCEYCLSGRYNLCPKMEFYATPPIDGAFCDYVTIQSKFAHPIPDSISDDAAALLEPLSVGIAAVQKAEIGPGATVLIAGGGPIGIITAQAARAFGATDVVISEPNPTRREIALAHGATRVVEPGSAEYLAVAADTFIDCSGVNPAIVSGIKQVKPAGTVVLVGMGEDILPLPVGVVTGRELKVTGIFRYTGTWPIGIRLVEAGLVQLDPLVTGRYGLDEVAEALSDPTGARDLKRIVRPGERGLRAGAVAE
ncbi:NAD(P)-dependent alcohol dehydrogenase [Raineyella sp. LH-20]|uniref:NAD(P)-dependent alcohol dehydrogenase n=1 Tax=Raineyella sp. LH-20 TaxID=3081204 RepID=UPI0029532F5C|nr:NAD(P)-dependent alcohol dehydrogenase [Raineyella sp. LH-20]WOP19197.1 NAD(P)-dependent alcohol dehydrogenase [Raineyella sp. LH-20]